MKRFFVSVLAFLFWVTAAVAQGEDRGFIAGLLEDALGGDGRVVRVEGFSGALSSTARIEQVTIADDAGVWLTIEDAALTWSRSALLRGAIDIEKMTAARIALTRVPAPAPSEAPSAAAPGFALPDLPVSVKIADLGSPRIEIGAPILGGDLAIDASVALTLDDGVLDAALSARRVDGKTGAFEVQTGYANEDQRLVLNLNLIEGADGLVSGLMGIPGRPALDLSVAGQGPLTDFTADLALKTEGVDRLRGQVRLAGVADTPGANAFDVNIGGDVTALFAPQYRPFFGPDIQLSATGARAASGAVDLEAFRLSAQSLQLAGAVALAEDGWPRAFDVTGTLQDASGAAVLLPMSGPETRVQRVDFDLQHDAAVSDEWRGMFDLRGVDREDVALDRLRLDGDGRIDIQAGATNALDAALRLMVEGLDLGDPALNQATGQAVTGRMNIAYAEGAPIRLEGLNLSGPEYQLAGNAVINGLDAAFESRFDVSLTSGNIAFLSGVAGRPLGGAVAFSVTGQADAGGAFDVALSGETDSLRVGIDAADAILDGQSDLDIQVARGAEGIRITRALVRTPQAQAQASGLLTDRDGAIDFDLSLKDVALVAPDFPGAANVAGTLTRTSPEGWAMDVSGTGPYRAAFSAKGDLAPALAVTYDARLQDVSPLAPGFSGPVAVQGTAQDRNGALTIETALQGPAGTTSTVAGTVSPDIDVTAKGNAPLGLINRFIAPRSVQGIVQFDLRQQGSDLAGLSGQVDIVNSTAVLPDQNIGFTGIGGRVTLAQARARIDVSANGQRGGTVGVNGQVGITGALPADLVIALNGVQLEDPDLYRSSFDGRITVQGPLQNGARIAGRIDVGETLITIASASIGALGHVPDIRHVGASANVRATQRRAGVEQGEDAAASGSGAAYPIDLTIAAPARVFVRGRGLDAEVRGELRLTGTTARLISAGGFELVRGRFDILNQRFDLTEGRVALVGDFDPFLNFVATTDTSSGTASVTLTGRASEPEVLFSSSPPLPQEEVLAQLIFGRDLSSLSAFQALQLANAVATLAGREGVSLLGRLREGFALDDLDVTTDGQGNTNVRAGKYLTDNVYTDVILGNGEEAGVSINIDLTPSITLRGAATQGTGTSLGVFFERDY